MSWQASVAARQQTCGSKGEPLAAGERHILLLLATYYDDAKGVAWPSIERIANESGYTTRRVQQIIQALEGKGLVEREGHGGRRQTNHYSFHFNEENPEAHFSETDETTKPIAPLAPENPEAHFAEMGNGEISGAKTVKSATGNPEAGFTQKKGKEKEKENASSPKEEGERVLADAKFMAQLVLDFPTVRVERQAQWWLDHLDELPERIRKNPKLKAPGNYKNALRSWLQKSIEFGHEAGPNGFMTANGVQRNGHKPPPDEFDEAKERQPKTVGVNYFPPARDGPT